MMDGWHDITKPIAPPSAQRVTVGWRVPGKGSPGAELVLSAALLRFIGWQPGTTRLRIMADTARQRLALVPDPEGKLLCAHATAGSLMHILPWVESAKRPSLQVVHRLEKGFLVLELPEWAQGAAAPKEKGAEDDKKLAGKHVGSGEGGASPKRGDSAAPGAEAAPVDLGDAGVPSAILDNPAAGTGASEELLTIWTPARVQLLRDLWNDSTVSVEDLQTRLCALPGASMSRSTIYKRAKTLRLLVPRCYYPAQGTDAPPPPPHPAVVTAPPPPPAAPAGPITPATNTQRLRAEITELMAAGHRGRAIAEQMGEPLSIVLGHVAAIEAAQRAAAP